MCYILWLLNKLSLILYKWGGLLSAPFCIYAVSGRKQCSSKSSASIGESRWRVETPRGRLDSFVHWGTALKGLKPIAVGIAHRHVNARFYAPQYNSTHPGLYRGKLCYGWVHSFTLSIEEGWVRQFCNNTLSIGEYWGEAILLCEVIFRHLTHHLLLYRVFSSNSFNRIHLFWWTTDIILP